MRDEFDDRIYQAARADLNASLTRLFDSIAYAFDRLTAQLYDAPWINERRNKREACKSQLRTL